MALTDVKSEQIQSSVALAGSPTTTTQSASDNSTKIATTAYVETAVANLVASAPAALNTLDELAAALNDDASFSTTITNSIATKLPLAGGTLTGALVGTTATFAGGAANNNDDANILTLNASQHARLLVDTSSTSGHRATLALESNGNELTLATTGSTSYLGSVGNLEISGGNVGIGASNPSQKLHVVGKIKSTDDLIIGGANPRIDYDGGSSGALRFFSVSANTERMRINSSGTVGIGTTDLHSWATFDGRLRIGARAFFGTTTGSSQMGYNWYYDGAYKYIAGDYANRYIQNDGHHWWQNATSGSADGTITWVSAMRLNRDGRLALGPDHMDILIDPASTNSGNNLIYLRGNASGDKAELQLNHYGYADYHIGVGHVANGMFNIANTQTGNDFVINSNGHVAIGASPDLTKFIVEADYANWTGRFRNTNAGAYGLSVDLSQSSAAGGQANVYAFATYTPANTGLVITKNGSVGIRTATPGSYGLNILGNDNQVVIDGNGSSANSGLFFAEQGTNKWEVYHRGVDDTFRIYNYATSSPNIQISAAGAVTKEKQPYVQGRGNAGWSSLASSPSWNLQPHGNTPITSRDHGNNYSTTNKRFTCPVDGVYLVEASWYIYQSAAASYGSQYVHPAVFKNGSPSWNGGHQPYTISGQMMNQSGTSSKHYDGVQISFTIYCSATDYLEIYLYSPNSNAQSYENYHYFSYTLLG